MSLCETPCSQNVERWVICFDHCRIPVFHDWQYIFERRCQIARRKSSFLLYSVSVPEDDAGSNTLHVIEREALILN